MSATPPKAASQAQPPRAGSSAHSRPKLPAKQSGTASRNAKGGLEPESTETSVDATTARGRTTGKSIMPPAEAESLPFAKPPRKRSARTGGQPDAHKPADAPPRVSVTKTTLTEQTYEVLKERILDRKLAPGARLNIDALTRDIGVSSSPLREALARLEAERLVVSALYSGYIVAPEPTLAYLHDLIDFRIILEGHSALVGAPRRDPNILDEMHATIRQMGATRQLGTHYKQYRKFVAADTRFHQLIVASARNEVVSDTYRGMNAILLQARLYLHRASGASRAVEVSEEHNRILHAFESGDGPAAQEALRAHLEGGKRRLLSNPPG